MDIIAHRGASAYAPENTLASFRAALRLGAQACEFDVRQNRDGVLVVLHDASLRRTAKVRAKVNELNFQELQKLDAGSWFSDEFAGEHIPTLGQVLKLLSKQRTIHLEIKSDHKPYPGIEQHVINELLQANVFKKTVISSFDHEVLKRVRNLRSDARLGYLLGLMQRRTAISEAVRLGCESIHLHTLQVNSAWVKEAHAAGMKINVYTVNNLRVAQRLARLGVDNIFSNKPDLLH